MNVLFIDTVHPILEKRLLQSGYKCVDATQWNREEILERIHKYQGVVIRSKFTIDKPFLDTATGLKFIARSGSGLENIEVDYAEAKGVKVFNSPEGNQQAVAEHVVGMLLNLFNKLPKANVEVNKGIWDREGNRGMEIQGKTIGIIGCGHTGGAVAKVLSGFGCRILGYDKYKSNYGTDYLEESTLADIYAQADIVTIHLPLTQETHYYANEDFFDAFKKPIYFVNASRGKNTNTEALVKALRKGEVLGACLDVLEYEKASFDFDAHNQPEALQTLKEMKQVLLTPHVAGWTVESYVKLSNFLADKILAEFGVFSL